jgi:hypothetical protein
MAGIPFVRKWLEEKRTASHITPIESTLPTAKTARLDRVHERVRALLDALPTLLHFYDITHQAKRFSIFRGKQRADAEMVNIFLSGGKKYNNQQATPSRPPTATKK